MSTVRNISVACSCHPHGFKDAMARPTMATVSHPHALRSSYKHSAHMWGARSAPGNLQRTSSSVAPRAAPSTLADTAEPLVEEVMVPHPIVFRETMSVKDAARVMVQQDISGAPVVDSAGRLVGILSESDLMWKGAGAPADHFIIPPIFIGAFDAMVYLRDNKAIEEELHKLLAKTVGEAMTSKVIHVSPKATMSEATRLMLNKKVNRLPVVDENGKVLGVLTRHDVLRGLISSHSPFLQ